MKIGAGNFRLFWILLTIGLIQTRIVIYAQAQQLEYKVCATNKISTFESELNTFGLKGFRVDPNTKLSTTTVILSKSQSDLGKKYEYKLIDSSGIRLVAMRKPLFFIGLPLLTDVAKIAL